MPLSARFAAAIAAVAAVVLPACDGVNLHELKPGISTAAEVRARMGEPSAVHPNPDGSVTWEYSRQPNGIECHMLSFGPDQVLTRIEQALSEANLARVREGMDKEEIRRLLGRPGWTTVYANLGEEVWDWRVAGTIPTEEAHFHVHFDLAGERVKRTSRRVESRG